jgi:hypothetical protein
MCPENFVGKFSIFQRKKTAKINTSSRPTSEKSITGAELSNWTENLVD